MKDFVVLSPSFSYHRACDIMKRLFGRTNQVNQALLKDSIEGSSTECSDTKTLYKLAMKRKVIL